MARGSRRSRDGRAGSTLARQPLRPSLLGRLTSPPGPRHSGGMTPRRLYRSQADRKLAGVCAGLAEYLGVDATLVRVATVALTLLTAAPLVLAYIVLTVALPVGTNAPRSVEADWQADGLRVSWAGPTVPYAVPWPQWLGGLAAGGCLGLVVMGLASLAALALGPYLDPSVTVSCGLSSLFWPIAAIMAIGGLIPRRWALTVTHDALWVERPLKGARRVDLLEVDSLHHDLDALTILLRDGELLRLAPPPQDDALDVLREQLDGARRRALGHREDLEQAEEGRQRLQALLAARQRQ